MGPKQEESRTRDYREIGVGHLILGALEADGSVPDFRSFVAGPGQASCLTARGRGFRRLGPPVGARGAFDEPLDGEADPAGLTEEDVSAGVADEHFGARQTGRGIVDHVRGPIRVVLCGHQHDRHAQLLEGKVRCGRSGGADVMPQALMAGLCRKEPADDLLALFGGDFAV
jgi:hypothetical protein